MENLIRIHEVSTPTSGVVFKWFERSLLVELGMLNLGRLGETLISINNSTTQVSNLQHINIIKKINNIFLNEDILH